MSDIVSTIKVKPWGEGQGDFVEINEEDFDAAVHTRLGTPAKAADPLDHDSDGEKGGSEKGEASTARKGAAKRKKAAK